mmetsp:Transcript_28768/g.51184  ORF Transcript_28768/g.51184 Transcript_28768/m.51184 type:complete len:268 (+) Transcript_28768:377-1180(+)
MEGFPTSMAQTVKKATNEREKLGLLRTQMEEMGNDFEDMQRAREEAKKQLEAKFQDVHRKIQATKDYVASEGKRVNDLLKAFQSKFEFQLNDLRDYVQRSLDQERKDREDLAKQSKDRMDLLERMIIAEAEERKKQTDEMLRPIREHLELLQKSHDAEKQARVEKETEIMERIDTEVFKISETMDEERTERIVKQGALRDSLNNEIEAQAKARERFQRQTLEAMSDMKAGLETELTTRLDQQDTVIDNISNFLKTFQDTLKIMGKDV